MSEFVDDITKSRRLCTLRVLRENEGAANESILRKMLHGLGFRGRLQADEALDGDADMLKSAGLVTIEYHEGRVRTLVITKRGLAFLGRRVDPVTGIDYPDVA